MKKFQLLSKDETPFDINDLSRMLIILATFLIPLAVRLRAVTPTPVISVLYEKELFSYSFFHKIKAELLLFFVGSALVIYLISLITKKAQFQWHNSLWLWVVFIVMMTISSLNRGYIADMIKNYGDYVPDLENFIANDQTPWLGFSERYEGYFVWIAYFTLTVLVYNLFTKEKDHQTLFNFLMSSGALIGIISFLQYIGMDPMKYPAFLQFLVPLRQSYYLALFNMPDYEHIAAGTLYTINYLGGFMGYVLPLSISVFMYRKNKSKLFPGIAIVFMFIGLLSAASSSGYIGFIFGTFIIFVLNIKEVITQKYWLLGLGLALTTTFIAMNLIAQRPLNEIKDIAKNMQDNDTGIGKHYTLVQDIERIDSGLFFTVDDVKTKVIIHDEDHITFLDEFDQPIDMSYANDKYSGIDEKYKSYSYKITKYGAELVVKGKKFLIRIDGVDYGVIGSGDIMYPEAIDVATIGFVGYERLFNGRGYIWSRSLPLFKDTLLVGKGADMYAASFPQQDVIGKGNFLSSTILVDKPHNIFLQLWINNGLIGLIVWLVFIIIWLINYLQLYRKMLPSNKIVITGLVAAITSYLLIGLIVDSALSYSPVFYVLLGFLIIHLNQVKNNAIQLDTDK